MQDRSPRPWHVALAIADLQTRVRTAHGLRDDGCIVTCAQAGLDFPELVRDVLGEAPAETRPDLLILDLSWPGGSVRALEEITELLWLTHYFLLAENTSEELAKACFKRGALRLFDSPTNVMELRTAVKTFLTGNAQFLRGGGRPLRLLR